MTTTMEPVQTSASLHEGWRLSASLFALIGAGTLLTSVLCGPSPEVLGWLIRMTARSSLILFCLAYSAGASAQLFPGRFSAWQRRNRRHLGLSFAGSHLVHALTILALAHYQPESFALHLRARSPVPGLVAYALILAMALTSSDRAQAWLGMRAWKTLHSLGALYVWLAFAKAFWIRVPGQPLYLLGLALLVFVMGLRLLVWRKGRVAWRYFA